MTIVDLAIFLLASYGLTNAINAGKIFSPLRKLLSLISDSLYKWSICPMCVGFWVGIVVAFAQKGTYSFVDLFISGLTSSGFCWIVRVILARLGEDEL